VSIWVNLSTRIFSKRNGRSVAKLLTKDEAQRIAENIAKLHCVECMKDFPLRKE
jgi:hypothetical protein